MANIMLAKSCTLRCPYCFAQREMEYGRAQDTQIPLDKLEHACRFLAKGGVDTINLMGGEPTLHTKFGEAVRCALDHVPAINILTNGLWNRRVRDVLRDLPAHRSQILINANEPNIFPAGSYKPFLRNLEFVRAWPNVTLGINIYKPDYDYSHIREILEWTQLKSLRWSLCYPIASDPETYQFRVEEYSGISGRLVDFLVDIRKLGVMATSDCGTPTCLFTDEQIGRLYKYGIAPTLNECKPLGDITIELEAMHCFPLHSMFRKPLDEFDNVVELRQVFEANMWQIRGRVFPMEACGSCEHRMMGTCQGGCLASSLIRHGVDLSALRDVTDPEVFLDLRLQLGARTSLQRFRSGGGHQMWVVTTNEPTQARQPMEMDRIGKSFVDLLDGTRTTVEAIAQFAARREIPEFEARAGLVPFIRQLILNQHLVAPVDRLPARIPLLDPP